MGDVDTLDDETLAANNERQRELITTLRERIDTQRAALKATEQRAERAERRAESAEREAATIRRIYELAQALRYRMRDIGTAPFAHQNEAVLRADYAWKTLRTALEQAALSEPSVGVALLAELAAARERARQAEVRRDQFQAVLGSIQQARGPSEMRRLAAAVLAEDAALSLRDELVAARAVAEVLQARLNETGVCPVCGARMDVYVAVFEHADVCALDNYEQARKARQP